MFGIAKPCRHVLGPELQNEWMGHLCGLCLALRDGHGQAARVTTNVDAVVLSILVDAQREERLERTHAAPCPLRGMRSASVVAADEPAAQHAVAVSLTMAATKLEDHALDHDGLPGKIPGLSLGVSRRWSTAGERAGRRATFETSVLRSAVNDSTAREQRTGLGFDDYVAPTEEAAAAAIAHTAVLAGRPANRAALLRVGRAFGRITYVLDAIDDEAEDIEAGRFNPLVATCPEGERRRVARDIFVAAHRDLAAAFDELELIRPALARAVVVDQLWRTGDARFHFQHRAGCAIHDGHRHDHHDHGRRRVGVHRPRIDVRELAGATRVLAKVAVFTGLATAAASSTTLGMTGFDPNLGGPGVGGEGFGGGMPQMPTPPPEPKQHWWQNIDCCDCGECGCCCCEGCDCCDCCDC